MSRTFISPDQRMREPGLKMKFNPLPDILRDKVLCWWMTALSAAPPPPSYQLLRKAGAREVHMRICAPPIRHPCFFGVEMASRWN
jgi:amidophosphoribosyltransferase